MSKIKIKIILNEERFTYDGIKSKNTIKYKDKDMLVKIEISNNITMIRENDDYKLELIFNNNESRGSYYLKKYHKMIDIVVNTNQLEIGENYIFINYKIEDNEQFEFKLEYEAI